jgi:hypothetical protein
VSDRRARAKVRTPAQKWSKVLTDYCKLIRSFEKAEGIKHMIHHWDKEEIEMFQEVIADVIEDFKSLQRQAGECIASPPPKGGDK